ncbi:BREX-2 system phosphatase PglZ [Agromyces laixinhei]|uniref:BREX-2 system phosphatase PglZ n=1 Tax=Agromyces laixinhei TaxID=2585717 RepID=UPI0012EEB0AC|nr:BREX-2 system phosphatase PglZ [Agromyces laixinhei]
MTLAGEASWAPVLDEATLRGRLRQWRDDDKRRADILLLRANPTWSGPSSLTVGDEQVHVINGISQLAVLDAAHQHSGEPIVVLTDLDDLQLGSAVRLRAERHAVQSVDAWELVPGLFKVSDSVVDRSVRELGSWLPPFLLTRQRSAGWPIARGGTLSGDHVIRAILADLIGVDSADEVDLLAVLEHIDEPQTVARLHDYGADELAGVLAGTKRHVGGSAGLALESKARSKSFSTLAVALVADLLWTGQADATVRVRFDERFLGGKAAEADVRLFGDAARAIILRREAAADVHLNDVLRQAEAIFADLDWPEGAAASSVLPAGLERRYEQLAAAIEAAATDASEGRTSAVDDALAEVRAHLLATHDAGELLGAEMATRLIRWLASEPSALPSSFGEGATTYLHDSAWADRALSVIWNGSARTALTSAYRSLAARVDERRDAEDAAAAAVLTGEVPPDIMPIESLLARVVEPLARERVLLIVLDGMSAAVAAELADEVGRLRWVEVLPNDLTKRQPVLATLPSVTRYSRSSLFAGRLTDGNQSTEKAAFAKLSGGTLFHKDDLRSSAGALLPAAVEAAVSTAGRKVVGVVLNTIDDDLAKADPDSTRWTLSRVANLAPLLAAAAASGRTVVLTSDHGHVIERGGGYRANDSGGARWRTATGDPAADEVLVSGARVLAPGGSAVLARAEGLRYTPKAAGYHGGAALAELTVPIVVFRPAGAEAPKGWHDAPPQAPDWWYERVPVEAFAQPAVRAASPAKPTKRAARTADVVPMFDITVEESSGDQPVDSAPLSEELVVSELYIEQRKRLGRHPLDNAVVAGIVDLADERGGRVHRDVLAARLQLAPAALDLTLTVLRRLLNIDGYDTVTTDADEVTIVINRELLREQFDLK